MPQRDEIIFDGRFFRGHSITTWTEGVGGQWKVHGGSGDDV